jgi:hypothetical protein
LFNPNGFICLNALAAVLNGSCCATPQEENPTNKLAGYCVPLEFDITRGVCEGNRRVGANAPKVRALTPLLAPRKTCSTL